MAKGQKNMRLSEEAKALLKVIQQHMRLSSETDALEIIISEAAERRGLAQAQQGQEAGK